MCYIKNSRNTFSQTHPVLLSFKVTTCFDSTESLSGRYFEPYTVLSSSCISVALLPLVFVIHFGILRVYTVT